MLVQVGRRVPRNITGNYMLINKHCSILPTYVGVLPVFWAMLHDEESQGVTIHRMSEEIDKGEILAQKAILNKGGFYEIYDRLYAESCGLILGLAENEGDSPPPIRHAAARDINTILTLLETIESVFFSKGNKFGFPLRIRKIC